MKKIIISIVTATFLFSSNYKEIRINDISPEVIHRLQDLGVDLDHIHYKKGSFIQFSISEPLLNFIIKDGIGFTIIHDDLESFYESRLYNISSRDFDYGTMGGYYTHDEIIEHLVELSQNYSHIVSNLQYLGDSLEGRPIYAVKFSDNPNDDENEPQVLYTGLHHAREPMSYMNLFYYMH